MFRSLAKGSGDDVCDATMRQRRAVGAAVGRPARRLGAQRGPAAPDLRGGARSASRSSRASGCSTSAAASARSCASSPTRGARPFGIDASEALIDARPRHGCPDADLRVGDMESAPVRRRHVRPRHRLQLVLLRQRHGRGAARGRPRRQARRPVVIQVWGAHEHCDLEAMKEIARPFFPPRPPDAPADPDSRARHARGPRAQAGLTPEDDVRRHLGLRVSRTRRRSAGRCSLRPVSRSSSAPSARKRSRRRSSTASPPTARPTGATGSRTSSAT